MALPNTLFLCVANSARSQMAEGLARPLCTGQQQVYSAGSSPTQVNPLAVQGMEEIGIDLSGQRSKGLEDVPMDRVDRVVTLCAEEVCPTVSPGVERLHWALPDPAAATGGEEARLEAFRAVRDLLAREVPALFNGSG